HLLVRRVRRRAGEERSEDEPGKRDFVHSSQVDDGRRCRRKFLTTMLLLAACGPPPEPSRPHETGEPHGTTGAPSLMEFQPPADAGSDFFCNVEGDCFRSETECARRHSACTKHGGTVHCFDLDSRGELLEVCHVTA